MEVVAGSQQRPLLLLLLLLLLPVVQAEHQLNYCEYDPLDERLFVWNGGLHEEPTGSYKEFSCAMYKPESANGKYKYITPKELYLTRKQFYDMESPCSCSSTHVGACYSKSEDSKFMHCAAHESHCNPATSAFQPRKDDMLQDCFCHISELISDENNKRKHHPMLYGACITGKNDKVEDYYCAFHPDDCVSPAEALGESYKWIPPYLVATVLPSVQKCTCDAVVTGACFSEDRNQHFCPSNTKEEDDGGWYCALTRDSCPDAHEYVSAFVLHQQSLQRTKEEQQNATTPHPFQCKLCSPHELNMNKDDDVVANDDDWLTTVAATTTSKPKVHWILGVSVWFIAALIGVILWKISQKNRHYQLLQRTLRGEAGGNTVELVQYLPLEEQGGDLHLVES